MSNTSDDERTSKKRKRDDLENEKPVADVSKTTIPRNLCHNDFPISCNHAKPTYYDSEADIVALMEKFGKRHNVEYENLADRFMWTFTCKGCEYVNERFKVYAKLAEIVKRHGLDVSLPLCTEYPSDAHHAWLFQSKDHRTGKHIVYAIDYNAEHVANCNWKGCRDAIPAEEMSINEAAKATVRAICKRIETMVEPHHEGFSDGLTNIQLAQIEVLDRVLTDIESVL